MGQVKTGTAWSVSRYYLTAPWSHRDDPPWGTTRMSNGEIEVRVTSVCINLAKAPFNSNPYASGPAPVPVDITVFEQHSVIFAKIEVDNIIGARRKDLHEGGVIILRSLAVVSIVTALSSLIFWFNIPLLLVCATIALGAFARANVVSKRQPKYGGALSESEEQHIREIGLKRLETESNLHLGWPPFTRRADGSNFYTTRHGCIHESEYLNKLLAKSYVRNKDSNRYYHKDYNPLYPQNPFVPIE
jgi:hypothetical protein